MAIWEFNEADPSDVDQELTQRDQFNNDEVGLAEALVREVIQNSSDVQVSTGPVKVKFSFMNLSGSERELFESQLEPLIPHLRECSIDTTAFGTDPLRVLVIEDFNTKGLTGRTDTLDEDNFRNFWRRHGKSSKGGKNGGRWGLGKLVYSSSSALRLFFGLTVRVGESKPLLMGQAVLANHQIEEKRYKAHGFWFSHRSTQNRIQLPIEDSEEIRRFSAMTGITRTTESGLSIVIPYADRSIDEATITSAVLANYYFPILSGRLEVEIGDSLIDRANFIRITEETDAGRKTGVPFDFIEEISRNLSHDPDSTTSAAIGGGSSAATGRFSEADCDRLRAKFAANELVHVRIPVVLSRKGGEKLSSSIDLFLKALPEGQRSFALFARGPITLPGERRYFQGSGAYGALIANDDAVAGFLGDAENPAHTAWNTNAEKLSIRWMNRQATLHDIRHALRELYLQIAGNIDVIDQNALIDFFSIADLSTAPKGSKKSPPKPSKDIPKQVKAISIKAVEGGFEIKSGPGATDWEFPRVIRVRLAYDMIGSDPFKLHSKYDFDLNDSEIELLADGAETSVLAPNQFSMVVRSLDFRLTATGFDKNRDLVINARAL